MYKSHRIISIVPAYNEAGKIGNVVRKNPRDIIDECLVVNDGSTDATVAEAEGAGAKVIHTERQSGIGVAIRQGIEYAIANTFDIIVVMGGNDKDDPADVPKLLDPIIDSGYDYVQGSRYLAGGRYGKMPLHRAIVTRLYPRLIRLVTGFPATDATNGFRAYRTAIFQDKRINLHQDWLAESLEYYLHLKVLMLGHKVTEIPTTKIYPQHVPYNAYTKVKPFIGWWRRIKPLIYLTFRVRD